MKIHELLSTEDKWTKTKFWHVQKGNDPLKEHNGKWCVATAILNCYPIDSKEIDTVLQKIEDKIGITNLAVWNNTVGYQTLYNTLKELDI